MNMGNMREISIEECNAVFGGTITVNGNPPVVPKTSGWIDPQLLSSLMGGSYGGYLRTQALILATQAAPDVALDEGHVDEGDDDGDGILNRDEEIVVLAPSESQITAALNRFSAHQASLPVSYWGFSGAMGLGIGFKFIYDAQTGEWDVDVAATAGLGFFAEAGAASDMGAANNASEATDNGWWIVGKVGGSAGGDAGKGRGSVGGQFGAGGMITDSEIIP
jgi:hypothetical protein